MPFLCIPFWRQRARTMELVLGVTPDSIARSGEGAEQMAEAAE